MDPLQIFVEQIEEKNLWEETITLTRNEYLKVGGSINTNLYYIIDGSLRAFVQEDNEELTIRFGYSGNLIASPDSFFTGQPSDLFFQALRKTSLKRISKERFMDFLNNSPEALFQWQNLLGHLICQYMERERDILTTSPQERYARVLQRSPRLFQEIPHKYIASYLRMTPETLSRIHNS